MPYLVREFVAANTWSLLFPHRQSDQHLSRGFLFASLHASYFLAMWPSTVMAGIVTSYFLMILLVHQGPCGSRFPSKSPNRRSRIVSFSSLRFLAFRLHCSLGGLELPFDLPMWIISGSSALVLFS
jgi:hypothetical protein